jgi:tetratricopeptide (TPR) repeat protein
MIATDSASHKASSWNQQTYQRLKLALSLGLRRQIFVAVCDDLSLRNHLAHQLHIELGTTVAKVPTDAQGYPKLVSLNLNLSDPNPLAQIAQWLAQNRQSRSPIPAPGFQFLGVELLTRQPAAQRLFLRHLQTIERYLPRLEATLLLWLPRPWLHTIQQSVPEFWRWHTGVFEFVGEPTPLPSIAASRQDASYTAPALEETTGSFKEELQSLLAHDLVDSADLVSLPKVKQEKQHENDDLENHQVLKGKPTDKTDGASSPGTNNGKAISYLTPNPGTSDAALTQGNGLADAPEVADTSLSLPRALSLTENISSKGAAPKEPTENGSALLHPDLKLGDAAQKSKAEQSEEPVSDRQSQILTPQSSELAQDAQQSEQQEKSQSSGSVVDAYVQLGNYYRQIIEQGDASEENLAIAIQAYEQALQFLDNASPHASDILNDIGNLYWMLSRCPTSAEHTLSYLEQSIQAYQLALTKLIAEEAPQTYAMIQNNLGAAYGDLARHKDSVDNLQQSIRAYEDALRYRRAQTDPMKYASTQNNLGTAYWHLAQQQSPAENLRAAIAAYAEALNYYQNQSDRLNWAMIQNNLGTAYWNLAQYEQSETWLQLATSAYQDALKYRTPEVAPAACAATQNNLGTAYWHLADRFQNELEAREKYLQQSIATYESAIALTEQLSQKTPPVSVNFDVIATRNNLGLAHYQLATEPKFSLDQASKSAHLEAALNQHLQACKGVAAQSDAHQNALSYVVKTIRAIYRESGITGQNLALSKVPGQLLPEILPRL